MFILFICLFVSVKGIGPFVESNLLCHWACDDPTCNAVCRPECEAPVCEIQCQMGSSCIFSPQCHVRCSNTTAPVMVSDTCPLCETVCDPLPAQCSGCSPLCEATTCSWMCKKPSNCPKPTCELNCEAPTCQYVPAAASLLTNTFSIMAIIAIVFITG